mmetsp:Transcript_31244/g.67254  ORF Transcript_31244/g.67254 Transcript_31244/m.67254 type:complete len:200 (-) Transcript_31244:1817-2416(-)
MPRAQHRNCAECGEGADSFEVVAGRQTDDHSAEARDRTSMEDGRDLPREGAASEGDHPKFEVRDLKTWPTRRAGSRPQHQPGKHGQSLGTREERPHQVQRYAPGPGGAAAAAEHGLERKSLQSRVRALRGELGAARSARRTRGLAHRGGGAAAAQGQTRQGAQGVAADHGSSPERDQCQEARVHAQRRADRVVPAANSR